MGDTAASPRLGGAQPDDPALTKVGGNVWSFLSVSVVVLALVGIVTVIVRQFTSAADASSVLAVVIPAFATIGAAVFGVSVGYSAGQTKGESAGVAKGEEKMKSDLREPVERVKARAEEIRRVLMTSLGSAPGERTLRMPSASAATGALTGADEGRPFSLDLDVLDDLHAAVARLDQVMS